MKKDQHIGRENVIENSQLSINTSSGIHQSIKYKTNSNWRMHHLVVQMILKSIR